MTQERKIDNDDVIFRQGEFWIILIFGALMTRILFVDDEHQNIQIMKEILSFYSKYEMEIAVSGEEALDIVEEISPDIVLLDIMMPGIDGFEVCRKLRLKPDLNRTKIIMVSGLSTIGDRLKAYEYGADDYITKPFVEDELIAKLDVFAKLNRMEEFYTSSVDARGKDINKIRELITEIMDLSMSIQERESLLPSSLEDIKAIQTACSVVRDLTSDL